MGGETSLEDQVAWYKSQYEQLETELADFRISSQELEQELEKDLEAAEKRETSLREKAESLNYEVDEWKVRIVALTELRCRPGALSWLTAVSSAEKIQGIQDRDQRCPEHVGERNNDFTRYKPNTTTQIARHRGGER